MSSGPVGLALSFLAWLAAIVIPIEYDDGDRSLPAHPKRSPGIAYQRCSTVYVNTASPSAGTSISHSWVRASFLADSILTG